MIITILAIIVNLLVAILITLMDRRHPCFINKILIAFNFVLVGINMTFLLP